MVLDRDIRPESEKTKADVDTWVTRLEQAIADMRDEIARTQGAADNDR